MSNMNCLGCNHSVIFHNEHGCYKRVGGRGGSRLCKCAVPTDKVELGILKTVATEVYKYASIAVNQIICMGGDETCQPCQNREDLARSLAALGKVLDETK